MGGGGGADLVSSNFDISMKLCVCFSAIFVLILCD